MSKYRIYTDKQVLGSGKVGASIMGVGESPGEDECIHGIPFIGRAGEKLNSVLARQGINRQTDIWLDNLCQWRPWGNDFDLLLGTPQLEIGLQMIHQYIKTYRPVVIVAFGNYPLWYLTRKGKRTKAGKVSGISNWRGSILPYVDDTGKTHYDIKVVPTFHPSFVSYNPKAYPIFDKDLERVKHESTFRGLKYTEREIIADPRGMELEHHTQELCRAPVYTCDIETIKGTTHILSISFSPSKHKALVINPSESSGLRAVDRILRSGARKVFHFGLFDTTQLGLNGFQISQDEFSASVDRLYYWDTYNGAHVLEPELPKTLAYETSYRTREPYYKHEGKEEADQKGWSKKIDRERLYKYNAKDTCVDFEIFEQQEEEIHSADRGTREIFAFEMASLEMQQHISLSGMLIDQKRLEQMKLGMVARWAELQYILNGLSGRNLNIKSPKLADYLYGKNELNLPPQYFTNPLTKKKAVTTNDDALVKLISICRTKEAEVLKESTKEEYRVRLAVVQAIREIRGIRQRLSMYVLAKQSLDGRSRSLYKNGPETGRWAASKFVDGTGYNHMTNPRDPVEIDEEKINAFKSMVGLVDTLDKDDNPEAEDDEEEE